MGPQLGRCGVIKVAVIRKMTEQLGNVLLETSRFVWTNTTTTNADKLMSI